MSSNQTEPFLIDTEAAKALYKDLRDRIPSPVEVPVTDVQVNGTSIINDGVANIPYGSTNTPGVFKRGSGLYVQNGTLGVNSSTDSDVKSGAEGTFTTVSRQHMAAFYGLAKVAGADLASETVTLGQYPNPAKAAIAQMFGIGQLYSPMEEITRETIAEDVAEITVNIDKYGLPFKLAYAQIILIYGTAASGRNDYIRADVLDTGGARRSLPTMRLINTSWTWLVYNFMQFGGLGISLAKATSTGNSQPAQDATYTVSGGGTADVVAMPYITGARFSRYDSESALIPAGSQIIIHGCRIIE